MHYIPFAVGETGAPTFVVDGGAADTVPCIIWRADLVAGKISMRLARLPADTIHWARVACTGRVVCRSAAVVAFDALFVGFFSSGGA